VFRHSVLRYCPISLAIINMDSRDNIDSSLESLGVRELFSPIPYDDAPLLRPTLVPVGPIRHFLILTISHLISDAFTLRSITRELSCLYACLCTQRHLSDLKRPYQFSQFALAQRSFLASPLSASPVEYWKAQWNEFEDAATPLESFLNPPIGIRASPGQPISSSSTLSKDIVDRIRKVASKMRATLFMLFLTCFAIALNRVTNRSRVAIWVNLANRSLPGTQDALGWFVHTHLLGVDLSGCCDPSEALGKVRRVVLSALRNQCVPTAHLWRIIGRVPAKANAPGSILFDFLREEMSSPAVDHKADTPVTFTQCGILKKPGATPMTVDAKIYDRGLFIEFVLTSNTNVLDSDVLSGLLEQWKQSTFEVLRIATG